MKNTPTTVQNFLDQLLDAGQDLVEKTKAESAPVLAKGKDIAAKGEDLLVDKLGLDDNTESREALRKGVGVGAAAGALALLLSSRSGRKIAKIGGIAGLGTLAYQAYKKNGGNLSEQAQSLIGSLTGTAAEDRANAILQAMIAAAQIDGRIDPDEAAMIKRYSSINAADLQAALNTPPNPKTIAALANSEQAAREIFAASARVANGMNAKERQYLDRLAMHLNLEPEIAARLETDARTG